MERRTIGKWVLGLGGLVSGWAVVAAAVCAVAWLLVVVAVPFPSAWLSTNTHGSIRVLDRHGAVLRHVPTPGGGARQVMVGPDEVAPAVIDATLAGEDHRFEEHAGVDPWAVARAVSLNLEHREVYSGASTLTMQLVRLLDPRPRRRGLADKLDQAVLALRLERRLSKQEIVLAYLNRAPYGNNVRGIEMASQLYFHKSARDLSVAESTFLAVLPRSPSGYNPYRPSGLARAQARQRHVLELMHARGVLSDEAWRAALAEPLQLQPRDRPFAAPHFVDTVLGREGGAGVRSRTLETTLDASLQARVERAVAYRLTRIPEGDQAQAAVVVMDVASGDVLAMVGSRGWQGPQGQFNAALARRPVGTTALPLLYAVAMEEGLAPSTVLMDAPELTGGAARRLRLPTPDGAWAGPVSARRALVEGRLAPAEQAMAWAGADRVRARAHGLGVELAAEDGALWTVQRPEAHGHVRLIDLVALHATLARGGEHRPARWIDATIVDSTRTAEPHIVDRRVSAEAAYLVTHMLADEESRVEAFGEGQAPRFDWPVALMVHTDDGGRDLWAFGTTQQVAVGVWLGRFDGRPLPGTSALDAAVPLVGDVLDLAMEPYEPSLFTRPEGLTTETVCAVSGLRAEPDCPHLSEELFVAGTVPERTCDWHTPLPVDRRNGMLSSWACDAPWVEVVSFVRLPVELAAWRRHKGLTPPPPGLSPECTATGEDHFYPPVAWTSDLVSDASVWRATHRRRLSGLALLSAEPSSTVVATRP